MGFAAADLLKQSSSTLDKATDTCSPASLQLLLLHRDFEYNLKLLDGRDAELQRYDAQFSELRAELVQRDGLIAEMRLAVAQAESGEKRCLC